MALLESVILRGTRAAQPAANTVAVGALYYVTDEAVTERSSGSAWETYSDAGGGGYYGDVVGPGSAVDERVAVFDGITGKLLKDGGSTIAEIIALGGDVTGPASSTDHGVARFDGATGKTLLDSPVTIEDDGRVCNLATPVAATDATTKTYVDGAIAAAIPSGGTQKTFLVSGGQIAWISAYTFRVSAASFYINGVPYTSVEQTIVLTAADPTYDRIDVIAIDSSSTVIAVDGLASSEPSEPDVNPTTQLKLGFVLVEAASSAPSVTEVSLYAENAGSPTEWDWAASFGSIVVASTNNPRTDTYCIEGTSVANGVYVQGTIGSGSIDPNDYDQVVLYIRSKATWNSGRVLRVQWYASGVASGTPVTVASGYWGFDSSITTGYQLVAIPAAQFAVPDGTACTALRITDSGGSIGFYLDDISLQTGAATGTGTTGLTQAQGDARYAPLVHATRHGSAGNDSLASVAVQVATVAVGGTLVADTIATFNGQYASPLVADGNSGASKTIDWAGGNEHYLTLTDDATLTFDNPVNGGRYVLLVNTGAGGYDITWPGTVKWATGTPVITAAAGKVDLFTFIYVDTTSSYYGAYNQGY